MALVTAALVAGVALVAVGLAQTPASATLTSGFTITGTIYTTPSGAYPAATCSGTPAPLYPGVTRCVVFTVTNNLKAQIRVETITTALDPAYPAPPSGCSASNLNLPGFSGSFTVAGSGGTANSPGLPIFLKDNGNQDNCENATLHFLYSGTATYTDSTSSVLGSSPSPSTAGQTLTLTDTVTSVTDSNIPAGSVLFYSCTSTTVASCSTTALGAAVPLSGGVATTTTTPATGGTYYYEAVYTPTDSTNFAASTSNVLTQTVSATASSKVLLWSTDDEAAVGSPVTYVADVLGPFSLADLSATGTMAFTDNGVPIPSCVKVPVIFGFATCTITYPTTSGSPHVITATYSGDAHHGTGTSNTVSETVHRASPTNTVTNTFPTTLGSTLKFTATVSGSGVTPTGTVTWKVSTPSGVTACTPTATLGSGVATCTITATKAGNYSVSDSYGGDANYTPAGSNTDTVSVAKATPTNVVTNSATPALGGKVTFTATITGVSAITPTGSVTWNVSGNAGANSCGATTVLTGGVATCVVTAAKAGAYTVSDTYVGDTNYASVSSNADTVSVAKATPTNVVTNSATPALGGKVTFTATVAGVSGITPTGSVTWNVSGSAGATSCGATTVLTGGVATCVVTATKAGAYTVSDTYVGDTNYAPVTSNADTVSVAKATPTDTLQPSRNPTTVGSAVTYTATVSGLGVAPTGSVTFEDGGSAITSCGTKGVVTLVGGAATCTVTYSSTTGSAHQITAPYGGDGNYTSVTSSTVSETVAKATPTNVVTNSSPTTVGSKVTFTATVSGLGVAPTGSVTWKVSGTAGVTSCSTSTTTLASGTASCVINVSKSGTYAVYETYSGDGNYSSLTSNTDTIS